MDEKELQIKFQMFEQQIMQIQQQLQRIDEAVLELTTLENGLEEIKGKKDSEILAPIGRGIFLKAKLSDDTLVVDVGEKHFVKKSVDETKEITSEQIVKLNEIKELLEGEFEKINQELTEVMLEHQKKHKHNHE